jgi:L-fuculose-phosphate aldolase
MRPDIKAIIHAHPPALVSFSIVHQIPDTNIISHAKYICGPIGYASYELPGSDLLGERIGAEFGKGYMAIIMENHGTVMGGSDLVDAFQRLKLWSSAPELFSMETQSANQRILPISRLMILKNRYPVCYRR